MAVVAAAALLGYLVGALPTGRWVAAARGVDPLAAGDREPGAANVWRLAGARAGLTVLALDLGKGVGSALVGLLAGGWWAACAGTVFAMAGHAWPVWSRWRGGRAVACLAGGALVLSPLAFAGALAVFATLVWPVGLWRAVAVAILCYPVFFAALAGDWLRLVGLGAPYLVLAAAWTPRDRASRRPWR